MVRRWHAQRLRLPLSASGGIIPASGFPRCWVNVPTGGRPAPRIRTPFEGHGGAGPARFRRPDERAEGAWPGRAARPKRRVRPTTAEGRCDPLMSVVSMKQLLEAGVHFGHQTRRWNPKMQTYIFTERNGIYIIDLQKTVRKMEEAYNFVRDTVADGGTVLFIGTKKQAQETIAAEAERCGMFYVNQRWLGGMLTNFATIKKRIERLHKLEKMEAGGELSVLPKKEQRVLQHEKAKLEKYLQGIKNMTALPDAVYVVDPRKENIAVLEARRLDIPIVAIVDTNCDPDEVDYVIPGNDDAIRAVKLITSRIADAVLEGRQLAQDRAQEAPAAGEAGGETGTGGDIEPEEFGEEPLELGEAVGEGPDEAG